MIEKKIFLNSLKIHVEGKHEDKLTEVCIYWHGSDPRQIDAAYVSTVRHLLSDKREEPDFVCDECKEWGWHLMTKDERVEDAKRRPKR